MFDRPLVTYDLYGLCVRSPVSLPAPIANSGRIDLDVRWGDPLEEHPTRLVGRPVARLVLRDGRGYCLARTETGWTLRFDDVADFRFDPSLRNVNVHPARGGDHALIPLLLAGNVVAMVLSLEGCRVLHASAVEFEGESFGFFGGSGTGKSTLAALCCASGARLIADDLLRLELSSAGVQCVRGPSELRLRKTSGSLAEWLPKSSVRRTPDDRLAIMVDAVASDHLRLRILAVPHPSRECDQISLERLGAVEALHALTRHARIGGWRAPELLVRQFTGFGAVAASVPVYNVQIPWGPPFPTDLGMALLDKLRCQARAEPAA